MTSKTKWAPLEDWREARHHVFAAYNKYGIDKAISILESKSKLTPNQIKGLRTELDFYHCKRLDLKLTPGLDAGDKADFTGEWNKQIARFQVSSKLSNKFDDIKRFEELSPSGMIYCVAAPIEVETCNYSIKTLSELITLVESKTLEPKPKWSISGSVILLVHHSGFTNDEAAGLLTKVSMISYDLEKNSAEFIDSIRIPPMATFDVIEPEVNNRVTTDIEEFAAQHYLYNLGSQRLRVLTDLFDYPEDTDRPIAYAELGAMNNPEIPGDALLSLDILYWIIRGSNLPDYLPFEEENRDASINREFRFHWA